MYQNDKRIVMTLDAGGTNFVFSAIQSNREIVDRISYPSSADNLERCLDTIAQGFSEIKDKLSEPPVAISFAFPGPADYPNGVIGDLPNFPSFRGGVALGAFLESTFGIPVYINNDGDLFAYGEAIAGALPTINKTLKDNKLSKRFKNLIGVTLGTGFGAGVVVDNRLLIGDNSDGGNVWNNRNKKYPEAIVEESVSIRAVKRVYTELSGDTQELTPKDIFDIAEGVKAGNREAAIAAFEELGEMAGDALAHSVSLIDGIVVIGGGLAGASKYIIPAIVREMSSSTSTFAGSVFPRMSIEVLDLSTSLDGLLNIKENYVKHPKTGEPVFYNSHKVTGVYLSDLGASQAIALGAYAFALHQIDFSKKIYK